MLCSECNGGTKVCDTAAEYNAVYRRRKCLSCGKTFYTAERIEKSQAMLRNKIYLLRKEKYEQ